MRHIFVMDIGLSAILVSFGVPIRLQDPVTKESRIRDGKETKSAKFWFDVSEDIHAAKAKWIIDAYTKAKNWEEYQLDKEHPLYWMKGVLENRTTLLDMFHNGAVEMRVIEDGDRTVYIGPKLSEHNKKALKKML